MSKQITISDSSYKKLKHINKILSTPMIDIIELMLCYSNKDDLVKFINDCNSNKITLQLNKSDASIEKEYIMYLNTLSENELKQKQFKINQVIGAINSNYKL